MTDDMTRRHDDAGDEPQRDVGPDRIGAGPGADGEAADEVEFVDLDIQLDHQLQDDGLQRIDSRNHRIAGEVDETLIVDDVVSDSLVADPIVPTLAHRIGELLKTQLIPGTAFPAIPRTTRTLKSGQTLSKYNYLFAK